MSSFDEAIDALADAQRRKLLVALLEHTPQEGPLVASEQSDRDAQAFHRTVEMNHVHLPKLEAMGFIEWDGASHEVSKGPEFDTIRPLLELLDDNVDELPAGYLPEDA